MLDAPLPYVGLQIDDNVNSDLMLRMYSWRVKRSQQSSNALYPHQFMNAGANSINVFLEVPLTGDPDGQYPQVMLGDDVALSIRNERLRLTFYNLRQTTVLPPTVYKNGQLKADYCMTFRDALERSTCCEFSQTMLWASQLDSYVYRYPVPRQVHLSYSFVLGFGIKDVVLPWQWNLVLHPQGLGMTNYPRVTRVCESSFTPPSPNPGKAVSLVVELPILTIAQAVCAAYGVDPGFEQDITSTDCQAWWNSTSTFTSTAEWLQAWIFGLRMHRLSPTYLERMTAVPSVANLPVFGARPFHGPMMLVTRAKDNQPGSLQFHGEFQPFSGVATLGLYARSAFQYKFGAGYKFLRPIPLYFYKQLQQRVANPTRRTEIGQDMMAMEMEAATFVGMASAMLQFDVEHFFADLGFVLPPDMLAAIIYSSHERNQLMESADKFPPYQSFKYLSIIPAGLSLALTVRMPETCFNGVCTLLRRYLPDSRVVFYALINWQFMPSTPPRMELGLGQITLLTLPCNAENGAVGRWPVRSARR